MSWFPLWQCQFLKPITFKPLKKRSFHILYYTYVGKKQKCLEVTEVGLGEPEAPHTNTSPSSVPTLGSL